jgi:hypothetical protein
MAIDQRRKLLAAQLQESLSDLDNAMEALDYSFAKCNGIGEKPEYNLEEQESFEALTARFSRATDILTQKAFKTLFALLQENVKTKIDAANLAEKLEIVKDADILLNIRELRNQIAHEYVRHNLNALFMDTLRYGPALKVIVENLKNYTKSNLADKRIKSSPSP